MQASEEVIAKTCKTGSQKNDTVAASAIAEEGRALIEGSDQFFVHTRSETIEETVVKDG